MQVTTPKSWVTPIEVIARNLVVRFSSPRRVISSAARGGGIGWAHAIINHQVSELFDHAEKPTGQPRKWEDPSRTLGRIADQLGISGRCVGLMTLVDLRHLVLTREEAAGLWVEGLFTVGVTNAVRAGEAASDLSHVSQLAQVAHPSRRTQPGYMGQGARLGTINMILVTNAKLAMAALVNAVAVATESKTAQLLEARIVSSSGSGLATGTGTDAIVIAIGDGPRLRYSGTHTKIGELIGRVVTRGIGQGLEMIK